MLRIEKVFLQGFKSFCDPTEVVFDAEGITAVVGPNGCGKSNLSEAISWVIGEQRARALRGGKMEDVIFQGSGNRAASGMAEVLLTMIVRETFEVRSENVEIPLPEDSSITPEKDQTPELEGARKRRKVAPAPTARLYQEGEEITVGRRLYRTGESEYEMNGRGCRLRDIQDLFSGTGLGGAHYAIIEQGRIGQVLSAKPLDRRALIEEAAGVSKFKMRQHAAELKLEASRLNLSRLADIIAEIERQQSSLKRQAARARRYQRLRTEMRDLMRAVYVADYRANRAALSDLAGVWATVSARESESQAQIVELEKEHAEATLQARNAETELNETRQTVAQTNLESERTRQQLSYLTEQLQSSQTRAEQFARDREAIVERSALITQEERRLREDLSSLEEEMKNAHSVLTTDEEAHRLQLTLDTDAEGRLERARTRLYETTTHLERWRQLHRQFSEAVDRCEQRMGGLRLEEERARTQARSNDDEGAHFGALLTDGDRRQRETSTLLTATQAHMAAARSDRAQRNHALATMQRELTATEHRLRSLVELDERHAYFSEAVQVILAQGAENNPGRRFTTLGTLADHVDASAEDESMIEAVLRDELQYVLVPTFDDAFTAIDLLKRQGGGRATFIVAGLHGAEHPTAIINSEFPESDPPNADGMADRVADTIVATTEDGIDQSEEASSTLAPAPPTEPTEANTLLSLLGLKPEIADTFARALPGLASAPVVTNVASAMEKVLAANGAAGSSIYLTRSGERIIGGRLVSGGNSTEQGAGILALRREVSQLREAFAGLAESVVEAEGALRSADDEIDRLETERIGLDTSLRAIEKEMAVLREQWQQCERERQRIATHLRVVAQEADQVEQELAEYRNKLEHAGIETNQAVEGHASAELDVASTQTEVVELRHRAEARAQEIARQRADYAAASERRRGLQNDLNRLENESRDLDGRLNRSHLEAIEADALITSLQDNVGATSSLAAQLTSELEEIGGRLSERTLKLSTIRERLEILDANVRKVRDESTQAREERAQLELDRVRLSSALDHISASCHHELGEQITEVIERLEKAAASEDVDNLESALTSTQFAETLDEDVEPGDSGAIDLDISFWRVPENFDLAAAKARLDDLRAKIDSLGPINMMALEELTEVEERFIFLSSQKADIEKAVSDTQAAIAEIRRRSRERFQEAFTAINENFSAMFQELFGGGRGEMRLIDESDILESGIEIIAQPPGKRLQNVLLLSGGEKAMAAIALVLAIFRYRPSPFCILDEVDAPLDEVNIGRFADKVTEMSRDTQFVIITHSKRTMEAARALYGVTMEDPGVSKLVSVRLT